jgi:hypothetical protein
VFFSGGVIINPKDLALDADIFEDAWILGLLILAHDSTSLLGLLVSFRLQRFFAGLLLFPLIQIMGMRLYSPGVVSRWAFKFFSIVILKPSANISPLDSGLVGL